MSLRPLLTVPADQFWVLADPHFGHANIIRYCGRPFEDVAEMDAVLTANWQRRVKATDTVFIVGDFGWRKEALRERIAALPGEKHLVLGNHDDHLEQFTDCFAGVYERLRVRVPDPEPLYEPPGYQHIVLDHYAGRTWENAHRGWWQLYGHEHKSADGSVPYDDPKALSLNVNVELWGYAPLSYVEVKAIMTRKDYTPPFNGEGK